MRKLIAVAGAAALVLGLAACSDDGERPGYARVCIDEQTKERVAGERCGSDGGSPSDGFLFWYLLYGSRLPAYGAPVTGGYRSVPGDAIVQQAERARPGKSYTTAKTRTYSNGAGTKLGQTRNGSGYKAPAPAAPKAPAPAVKNPNYRPAPVYRPPAPVYRAPAPVFRSR